MLAFLVQRISQAFLVMFVISVIAFAIQDGLGDPLQEMVGMSVSEEEREAILLPHILQQAFAAMYTSLLVQITLYDEDYL